MSVNFATASSALCRSREYCTHLRMQAFFQRMEPDKFKGGPPADYLLQTALTLEAQARNTFRALAHNHPAANERKL